MKQQNQKRKSWAMQVPLTTSALPKARQSKEIPPSVQPEIYRDLAVALIGSSLDVRRGGRVM